MGSTQGVAAKDNTNSHGTGVPIYWLEGDKVADDYADFYDASWDSRIGVDEQARALPRERDRTRELYKTLIKTGTYNDGSVSRDPLGDAPGVETTSLDRPNPLGAFAASTWILAHYYALSPVLKIAKTGGL